MVTAADIYTNGSTHLPDAGYRYDRRPANTSALLPIMLLPDQAAISEVNRLVTTGTAAFPYGFAGARSTSAEANSTMMPEAHVLTRRVEYLQARRADLESQIEALHNEHEVLVADAAGSEVAMFILHKLVEAGRLDLATLAENLKPPFGWLAFARLWGASLIDCLGREAFPTDAGIELIHDLNAAAREARPNRG
ncbi:MAG: hypothetical protein ACYDCQ_13545 [Dehalococcoidia bacterium]